MTIDQIGWLCLIHEYLTETGHEDERRARLGKILDLELDPMIEHLEKEHEHGKRHSQRIRE